MKFEIGDKVEVIDNDYEVYPWIYEKGWQGKVVGLEGGLKVEFNNGQTIKGCTIRNFKKVEENIMKKSDLKTGQLVELKNNEWFVVVCNSVDNNYNYAINKLIYISKGHNMFRNFVDFEDEEITTVAVVDYVGDALQLIGNSVGDIKTIKGFKVIWERPNPQKVQLQNIINDLQKQMDEAQAKLKELN